MSSLSNSKFKYCSECFVISNIETNPLTYSQFHGQQERRLKKQEQKEKAAREAEAAKQAEIEETDDEKDDLEEDIEVTHF